MKLLFVHERLGALAGAESNILATARELNCRGHTVGLLHGSPTHLGQEQWEAVFPHRFPLAQSDNTWRTLAAVETFQPNVVYVHKMADLEVIRSLLTTRLPLVRMVHDHDLYCMRSYKYNYFTRRICQRAASPYCVFPCGAFAARNHSGGLPLKWVSYRSKLEEIRLNREFDRLIVASQFMKEQLVRNGFGSERIEIHPPVPTAGEAVIPSDFSQRNLIIYAGQIIRGKGVDVLLESLAQVRTPFECFIYGEGNQRAWCERLSCRLGLSGRVFFRGYVPPKELEASYRQASIAVMSSVWPEPFGAVGLEAMRHGLPVIAFDAGGIREWLIDGHNGRLVPWMDRAAFAARIEELLSDKALARKLGEQGRATVAGSYGFPKYIDGLGNMFARLAGSGQSTPTKQVKESECKTTLSS
jgi:glycosyltransferase involved in cell wall biosynthesis